MYPETESYDHGMLDVGDGHRIYWEVGGNPDGKPAVVLHRGPGSGAGSWITRDMGRIFPAEWARFRDVVPAEERDGNLALAYSRLLHDADLAVRERAARAWCDWEDTHVATHPGFRPDPRYQDPVLRLRLARIVTHYWGKAAWLEDGLLLREAGKLAGIPGVLVHGRLDISSPADIAWNMAQAWPDAELHLVEDAGHGLGTASMSDLVVGALDRFAGHH